MKKLKNIQEYFPDDIDKKIIDILFDDAKTTHRNISKKLDIAIGTVNTRIKRLEKNKIIRRYSAVIDFERLGYNIEVMISVKIIKGKFYDLSQKLINDPNIFMIFDMTGDYDSEIIARFKTKRQLDTFIKKLQQHEAVQETSTRLILNIIREKEIN
jgi:DNA-binding Lrp family transcriptional regulator